MWAKRQGVQEAVNELDVESFGEAVDTAYELVLEGCDYRRAIRIAIAQARQRARQKNESHR